MRQILIALVLGLLLTGCVFDFSSEAPVVGGLSLIDFTDRSGEEYSEKMGKLFTEHFSAEELAKISSIYQDGNYMLLLNEYLENPGPEQTRKLDACLRAKWGRGHLRPRQHRRLPRQELSAQTTVHGGGRAERIAGKTGCPDLSRHPRRDRRHDAAEKTNEVRQIENAKTAH